MLAAEEELIDQGTTIEALMERAGQGAAQEIWRISRDMPSLVLCGPGNNGGDGYVIAQWLREKGVDVSVAVSGDPKTDAARNAHALWKGETCSIEEAKSKPQIIDCLFGTGLQRPMVGSLLDHYCRLCDKSRRSFAVDVPSGIDSDTGQLLNIVPDFTVTIALGATKPAHYLEPARSKMGHIVGVDIGITSKSDVRVMNMPVLSRPKAEDHKYSRGLVVIVAGEMHGAAKLAALAAQQSGAGYVKLFAPRAFESPAASIVASFYDNPEQLAELLDDRRIDAVAIGPGLGRGDDARAIVDQVLKCNHKLVLDADALTVLGKEFAKQLKNLDQPVIATPHAGEFKTISGQSSASKIDDTMILAKEAGSTILNKGSDTVIASSDGNAALSKTASPWLSTAGTGDVLTGIIAARLAKAIDPFESAQQGHWLHSRAAQLAGPSFSPEKLIHSIPCAMAECL